MVEVLQTTIIAIVLGFVSLLLLRFIIPSLYKQDRRLAQLLYLNLFWVALFFVVYLYENKTISSLGVGLGDDILVTFEYTILCAVVTLLLFTISAKREKAKGYLWINKEKQALVIGNEGVDLSYISLPGYIQVFLMQIVWVALPLELFYRGYMITRITESFSEAGGIIMAAVMYFVAYIDKPIFGTINILYALLWGYSFVATGSILPGLISHIFINTTSFYFARNIALSSKN